MTKRILGVAVLCAIGVGAGLYLWRSPPRKEKPVPQIAGPLRILSFAPQGDEMPISTEGVTVMFDRPMVPLTTLDEGRDRSIPLEIDPKIDGTFFWLGTRGFIFRAAEPLNPATHYRVTLPAKVAALDGQTLDKPLSWDFQTVTPRILSWEPATSYERGDLLPRDGAFFIRFNLAMDRASVEKSLQIIDEPTGQILSGRRSYQWQDGDHYLQVRFQEELPWGSKIKITLPARVKAAKGNLGMIEAATMTYATPAKDFEIQNVMVSDYGKVINLEPKEITTVPLASGLCYRFSQPVTRKSFEKAFHVSRGTPYYYFQNRGTFAVVDASGQMTELEGYLNGCVSVLEESRQTYEFSVDPKKIESLSGATLVSRKDAYRVKTNDAEPNLVSRLTKTILSPAGPLKIPYRATNLDSLTARLYRVTERSQFTEEVKGEALTPQQTWDRDLKLWVNVTPPTGSLDGGRIHVPYDFETQSIDQEKMPADFVQEIPLQLPPNVLTATQVNLRQFSPSLAPGFYLLEVVGKPVQGGAQPATLCSIVQITPVAFAMKNEVDHVLVWATDIESGQPVVNLPVAVDFRDRYDSVLQSRQGTTGEDGVVIIPSTVSADICLTSQDPDKFSYSCLNQHRIEGMFPYQSALEKRSGYYYAYLYTDRPIYRPGQKVFFSSFIREVKEGRYFQPDPKLPADVWITDASGKEIDLGPVTTGHQKVTLNKGIISGEWALEDSQDIPRGQYGLHIKVGGQTFSKKFFVSSYRKPSFKVDLKTDQDEIISGEPLKIDVRGSYFFGAPLRKSDATWSIMTSTYFFRPEGYSDFTFFDPDLFQKHSQELEEGEGHAGEIYGAETDYDTVWSPTHAEDEDQEDDPRGSGATREGGSFLQDAQGKKMEKLASRLDAEGILPIAYKPDLKNYPTSQVLSVEANVQDPSHQEVSGAHDVIVHKASFYLGVKPQKWVYGEKEKAEVDVVSLDTQGKAAPKKGFTVDIIKRDYKFIQRRNARGNWEFIFEHEDTKLGSVKGTTDDAGRGMVDFQVPSGGTFRLVASGRDQKGNAVQAATTIDAWGEGYVPWRLDQPEKIELVPDKDSYQVGETAKILIKSLVPVSKALLTLERGRVLDYKIINLGGNASHLEIPITEGMTPNIYLSLIAHAGRLEGRPPLLFTGETELHVNPESKRLQVAVTADHPSTGDGPPIYGPGDKVTVRLQTQDTQGRPHPAHVMVSVADESVLRLLNYELPDLVEKFFYRRSNSVSGSDLMLSFKAGDGGLSGAKLRRVFKDTADFQADVQTDANGKAEFSFTLPDDLTTWVIEALAITDSKHFKDFEAAREDSPLQSDFIQTDGTLVGGARSRIMTTLPVQVRAALPRFAAWGDQFQARLIVNNRNPQPAEGKLKIMLQGDGVLSDDQTTQEIPFAVKANAEEAYDIPIRTKFTTGRLTVAVDALDRSGKALDRLETSLPVLDRFAPETVATSGMVATEAPVEEIFIPKDVLQDKGGLTLSVKASLGLAVAEPMRRLLFYPYGCSEQKSGSLLALLMARDLTDRYGEKYFDRLAPLDESERKHLRGQDDKLKALDDKIYAALTDLAGLYQASNGGIRYWPESPEPSLFPSVQVLWGFVLAKEIGYDIDMTSMASLQNYIQSQVIDEKMPLEMKVYGLWGLSLAGQWDETSAQEAFKRRHELTTTGVAYLLMGYRSRGTSPATAILAHRLAALAKQEPRHTSWPASSFFGSGVDKNTALATWSLVQNDPADPLISRGMAFLFNRKGVRHTPTTQDDLYRSSLAYRYAQVMKEDKTDFQASLSLSGRKILEPSFKAGDAGNLLDLASVGLPMKELAKHAMPAPFTTEKKGEGTLYYDLELRYYLPPDQTPTREEGLIISRDYFELDDMKEEKPLKTFEAGKNYKGHIILVAPQDMNYLLIREDLPAGFEPVDMSLATTSRAAYLQAKRHPEAPRDVYHFGPPPYDDIVSVEDYGSDYAFTHQEIHDDAILWSDEFLPAGVYHVRYPIRATTAGEFLMSGATAFEFYEPEIFGRSRARQIEIKEMKD